MPDLATPGDDRIGEIFPDHGQEFAGGLVPSDLVNVAGQLTQIIV